MFSFNRQKKLVTLQKYIRRLADVTSPNLQPMEGESRTNGRQNRVLPTVLIPWEEDAPVVSEATTALTKDVSDDGLGLVLHQPIHAPQVVIGLWVIVYRPKSPVHHRFLVKTGILAVDAL